MLNKISSFVLILSILFILSSCGNSNVDIDNIISDPAGEDYFVVSSIRQANDLLSKKFNNHNLITLVFPDHMNPPVSTPRSSRMLIVNPNQNVRIRCAGDIGSSEQINLLDAETGARITLAQMNEFNNNMPDSNISITRVQSRDASAYNGNGCSWFQRSMIPHITVRAHATLTLERMGLTTFASITGYGGISIEAGAHLMMNGGSINNITFTPWPSGNVRPVIRLANRSALTTRGTSLLNLTNPLTLPVNPGDMTHFQRSIATNVNAHVLPPWNLNYADY